jgi:hypothetical protein
LAATAGVEVGSRVATDVSAHPNPDQPGAAAVSDAIAIRLANEFAPILFYDKDEPNLPTTAARFLASTQLWFFSKDCRPQQAFVSALTSSVIPWLDRSTCGTPPTRVESQGSRSAGKSPTFYLSDVPEAMRRGSLDSRDWVTYLHAYQNDLGGVTLQFWRFYAYNTAYLFGLSWSGGSHGGDWEAIHIVFQPGPALLPVKVRLLGHSNLLTVPWSSLLREGTHPLIRCGKGSHTSELMTASDLAQRERWIEQQAWNGGVVRWPDRRLTPSGPIVNLGRKVAPAPGMEWLRYSGLWGTRSNSGLLPYYRSGYWGPAFNETGIGKDGFIAAWCEGMAPPRTPEEAIIFRQECYPASGLP